MGQNIGTCITAILASFGTNKNAKRAAIVHLSFNVIGTAIWLSVFSIISAVFHPALLQQPTSLVGIAAAHSAFNIACTIILLPASTLLEKLAIKLVPGDKKNEVLTELDERLLTTPPVALARCNTLVCEMADISVSALQKSLKLLQVYDDEITEEIKRSEERVDHYEDIIGTYLVKLSSKQIGESDSATVSKLLKAIGDFERISDHAINIMESAKELHTKNLRFTPDADKEMQLMCHAVSEISSLTYTAFANNDIEAAKHVEPLEQVVDVLNSKLKDGHINRLKHGICSIEAGFVWSDLLTNLERTADHCSNIAVCIIDTAENTMNFHASLRHLTTNNAEFDQMYQTFAEKYQISTQADS